MWCTFLLLTLSVAVQGRAVNISNTWVLPEEGFPVFYRYFRDRISWYEADAVCQFHHANLVTVDTTAQYDAVRAYLKELDISSAVWVGLIRSNPDGDFTWTDYRGLSGDGYWSSAPDTTSAPLCAAADPASDYRWEARACGGPSVASFICELPVPQWALGNEGCMVRALPALTILYLPESAAVQLTADCGLAGVKRVQCTGNVKREKLLTELSCEDQGTISTRNTIIDTTWEATTDALFTDQDLNNDPSVSDFEPTEHQNNLEQSTSIESTPIFRNSIIYSRNDLTPIQTVIDTNFKMTADKSHISDILDSNNLHSNEISKIFNSEDISFNEEREREEDEKILQHRKLHDELARLGNIDTIFSQTTDHFVPPLVMAKAKVSDDMVALSIQEKLAQQYFDQETTKHKNVSSESQREYPNKSNNTNFTTTDRSITTALDDELIKSKSIPTLASSSSKLSSTKAIIPKKYNIKDSTIKKGNAKQVRHLKSTKTDLDTTADKNVEIVNISASIKPNDSYSSDSTSLELSVILKEPKEHSNENVTNLSVQNSKSESITTENKINTNITIQNDSLVNDEFTKIEFIENNQTHITPTASDITTHTPLSVYKNIPYNNIKMSNTNENHKTYLNNIQTPNGTDDHLNSTKITSSATTDRSSITPVTTETIITISYTNSNAMSGETQPTTQSLYLDSLSPKDDNETEDTSSLNISIDDKNISINKTDLQERNYTNIDTETTTGIDDYQSPLLSAANEPIHKPIRSRRPQQPINRANKFNPFRILG